jgi:type II secretory pathway pseudopilin PulG
MQTRLTLQSGFTFLGLLAVIMIMGLFLTIAARVWSVSEQRDKEAQLLYVGDQFRNAIGAYFAFGSQYPLTLQQLVLDDRSPVPRRYLRQIYLDPMTGDTDWNLIKDPSGVGIMGVASKSKLVPIKRRHFADIEFGFANKDCYCDWQFLYSPSQGDGWHRYSVPGQSIGPALPAPAAPPVFTTPGQ